MSNYSSEAEVTAFTRHLLDGAAAFNSTTRPTSTEVGTFLTRVCGVLDVALAAAGLATPITQATAKLACDDWVTQQAVKYVHYTSRNTAIFSDQNEQFKMDSPSEFVEMMALGFSNNITSESNLSSGLQFTGMTIQSQRADPDDTTKEQPKFTRGLFDNAS